MRIIERSSAFKRDYKRVYANPRHRRNIDFLLTNVISFLAVDKDLQRSQKDHELLGEWIGYRECHIKPDLLLIYKKPDYVILRLARIGSHSELFG
jgi:mRNA interferase YafQ